MAETYEDKFNELKKSISNFTELDVEKPLGQKLQDILGSTYNTFLKEEINSISDDIQNVPLKNLIKNNSLEGVDYENFQTYYEEFVTKKREELEFDFDKFEELIEHYASLLLNLSGEINELEDELVSYFRKIDNIKKWVSNMPEGLKVNTDKIEEQVMNLINADVIKEKITSYKNLKMKYFFLKQYFFINPFISLAEDNDINCNDDEFEYKNDLESELNTEDEIIETSPSLLKSILDFLFTK
jgi:hypothetical protein